MKVLQFTIPVAHNRSVIIQEEQLPYFYPYLHRHQEIQLTHIIEGTGSFVVGTDIYAFHSGDIFFIGANQPHIFKSGPEYFEPEAGKKVRSLTIFFDPSETLEALFNLPEMKTIRAFTERHSTGFKVPAAYTSPVADKMGSIKEAGSFDRMICFLQLLKYLLSINNLLQPLSAGRLDKVSDNEGIRIGNVYNYIMQNYHTDISLENVARIACLTPQAFCRYFKKHTGNTFVGFLNEVRINEACKKLAVPGFESVTTVAYESGFKSITHFNRIFKTVTGKSPLAYVKDYKAASGY